MGFFRLTRFLLLFGAAVVLASCGGGSSSSTSTTPASITTSPTSLSMNHGDVVGIVSASVLDSTGTALTTQPTFTYSSSDPTVVTVTSTGQVCAGVFDANNIVCQIQPDNGKVPTANILVSGDGLTATVPIFVHARVDSVVISGPASPPVCLSQNQTEQFSAKAFSSGNDITSKVGPFSWSTGSATIATVDANGVVTSRMPGATTVVATITSTTGTPAVVVDCPPKSIALTVSGSTTNATTFNVASGTSQTLATTVTDILGQPITGASLTFSSFVPSTAVSSSSGGVTTPGAGETSIVASCNPPGCNPASGNVNANGTGVGLPVYSNSIVGAVTGSTATTVYVTGADNPDGSTNTSLIPITISSNAAGTAVTLQGSPNSMVFSPDGTKAYIGTNTTGVGLLIFDPTSNTVTATAAGLTGQVLTVSNDGSTVILSDIANGKVFVFNTSANTSQEFDVPGVTAAAFDSDNSKAYLTAGSQVYEFSTATATFKPLNFGANGVVFTPQESVAYFGGSSILGLAPCNDARVDTATGAANILGATPDGTHMIGAGAGGWVDLSYTVNNAPPNSTTACPPVASNTPNVTSGFGAAFVGTPTQIAVTSNTSFAFLTSYTGGSAATGLPFYQFATASGPATTGTIPLAGGGGTLFSGSLTEDAKSLYVGVSGGVHRIDLTQSPPVDANQISTTFNPRLVVVRPQ